jgi:hypothetical protein
MGSDWKYRRTPGRSRQEVTGSWSEQYGASQVAGHSMQYIILLELSKQEQDGQDTQQSWKRWEMHTGVRQENLKGKGHFEKTDVDRRKTNRSPDHLRGASSLLSGGYRGSIPGDKQRPGVTFDNSPHLVQRSSMSRSYNVTHFTPAWR